MSYNPNVPVTGHSGSQDYQAMQANFAEIQSAFSVNHNPLASAMGDGFHTQIQLAAALVSDPNQIAPIASVYTKGATPQLFFQNGNMASNVVQLTGNSVLTGSEYTIVSPWGLIFKFGVGTGATGTNIPFAVPFPTNGLGVVITIRQSGGTGGSQSAIVYGVNGVTGFIPYYGIAGPQAMYYVAWGN